jgi:hypothetical protein
MAKPGGSKKTEITGPVSRNEGGVLAALWRKVLAENNYMQILDYLIDRYVSKNDEFNGRVSKIKKKAKSTLISNVTTGDMTIKTFFDLVFNFLKVKKMTISIKLTFPNNAESVHSVTISGNDIEEEHHESDPNHKE